MLSSWCDERRRHRSIGTGFQARRAAALRFHCAASTMGTTKQELDARRTDAGHHSARTALPLHARESSMSRASFPAPPLIGTNLLRFGRRTAKDSDMAMILGEQIDAMIRGYAQNRIRGFAQNGVPTNCVEHQRDQHPDLP